jgi:SAM-dependent methyltransferase
MFNKDELEEMNNKKYFDGNLHHWNEVTPIHEHSAHYDVEGFKSGRITLKAIELAEVGDVKGKSLLHLQCHFGMDTLSWARLGADVTGVDFSDKAIDLARYLSNELSIKAKLIHANIYDLPRVLTGSFDIVFTSYGVLCWLPDLNEWAKIIAHYLNPGGFFYIVEGHPFLTVFDNSKNARGFDVTESYFHKPEPIKWDSEGDYSDKSAVAPPTYEWTHGLGDIINALIDTGLRIDFLHEFPISCYPWSPFTKKQESDGLWHTEGDKIPMSFSIKATRSL